MRYCSVKIVALTVLIAAPLNANGETVAGHASIVDGDTLVVQGTVIRLHGLDAAESGQRCISVDKRIARPGDDAEERLTALTRPSVTCTGSLHDDYGRLIAKCSTADKVEINRALVAEGLAWAYVKFSGDYVKDEAKAKDAGLGIWSMRCEPPWEFRAKRWEVAIQKAPDGCPIKGNISERGRIYHTPWSRHYSATKISAEKGERWFCNEGEALAAGWRAPVR
jgi:endonuclease YncB( thermonuclease family)